MDTDLDGLGPLHHTGKQALQQVQNMYGLFILIPDVRMVEELSLGIIQECLSGPIIGAMVVNKQNIMETENVMDQNAGVLPSWDKLGKHNEVSRLK